MSEYNERRGGSSEGTSTGGLGHTTGSERSQLDGAQDQAREYADKAKDKAGEYGDLARDKLEQGRTQAATGVQTAADTLRERTSDSGGVTAAAGNKVADSMETTASYFREHDTNEMLEDFEVYAKKHPAQTLVGAVVTGFLLGRLLR